MVPKLKFSDLRDVPGNPRDACPPVIQLVTEDGRPYPLAGRSRWSAFKTFIDDLGYHARTLSQEDKKCLEAELHAALPEWFHEHKYGVGTKLPLVPMPEPEPDPVGERIETSPLRDPRYHKILAALSQRLHEDVRSARLYSPMPQSRCDCCGVQLAGPAIMCFAIIHGKSVGWVVCSDFRECEKRMCERDSIAKLIEIVKLP